MSLLHHGSFVDVEGERDSVVMGNLDELLDVVDVGSAYVYVEENGVAVAVLPLDEVLKVGLHVFEGLWQARLFLYGVDGEVDRGDPGVGEAIKVNAVPATVIGVAADGFDGLQSDGTFDIIVPFAVMRQAVGDPAGLRAPFRSKVVVGRLARGVSIEAARGLRLNVQCGRKPTMRSSSARPL